MKLNKITKLVIALEDLGTETMLKLLEKCDSPANRRDFVKVLSIIDVDLKKLGKSTNSIQIEFIGEKAMKLLEAIGVITVKDLSTMNAKTLYNKLKNYGEEKSISIPSEEEVVKWIEKAKTLNH